MPSPHLFLLVLACSLFSSCGKKAQTPTPAAAPPPAAQAPAAAAHAAAAHPEFRKLLGKWLRPDGGYVIEIRSVDEQTGKMEAAYFNPQPIHVSKAMATPDGAHTRMFLELQGVNYPGSTYTLVYDPATDQLQGIYFQAALQQQFEVAFQRMP